MRFAFRLLIPPACVVTAFVLLIASSAKCEIIADSIEDWSPDGDQGVNGWSYGYFDVSQEGDPSDDNFGYEPELFIGFDEEVGDWEWTGTGWDGAVGDVPWTFIGQENGHPNGDNNGDIHFAIRRWESDFEGTAFLTSRLAKENLNCGNGTSVHVFQNGELLDTVTVSSAQSEFRQSTVETTLSTGDLIDFGLSPFGIDGTFNDGCDGSLFNLQVADEAPPMPPELVASSVDDWSFDGLQGENGWTYGYFNVTLDGDIEEVDGYGYTPEAFINFEDEGADWQWTGTAWDSTLGDVPWTTVNQAGGHPNGDNNGDVHFAMRRWESDVDGTVEITSKLGKSNVNCGNGTTVHVYQNGELLDTITVGFDEAELSESSIETSISSGDLIDLALSPLGTDDTFADGCDGSQFQMDIRQLSSGEPGDFNGDGMLTAADIDMLTAAVGTGDLSFDLDDDGAVDDDDRTIWVEELKNTWFGDSNLDGEFNSNDFVFVFTAGEYEDDIEGNSTWATGDWNGDSEFGSSDLVRAFQAGGFEVGPRAATAAVPEPSSWVLIGMGMLLAGRFRRRR